MLMLPVKNLEHEIQKRCEVKISHLLEHCDHLQNKISTIKTTMLSRHWWKKRWLKQLSGSDLTMSFQILHSFSKKDWDIWLPVFSWQCRFTMMLLCKQEQVQNMQTLSNQGKENKEFETQIPMTPKTVWSSFTVFWLEKKLSGCR